MDLKQGNMTFSEYEKRFNELSKFGPCLIDTTLRKNEKFIAGARPEYYDRLTAHVHGSFASLMDMAIRFENGEGNNGETMHIEQPTSSSTGKRKKWSKKSCSSYSSKKPADLSTITCHRCNQ